MSQIAKRYATALYAKIDPKNSKKVLHNLEILQNWYREVKEFRLFLHDALLHRDETLKVIERISSQAGFDNLTKDFLCLLARNRRLPHLNSIISTIFTLHEQSMGVMSAVVTSAQKLTTSQLKQIQETLSQKLNKTLKLQERIDPKSLGGLKIKVGPYLIDATLRAQMSRIQMMLKEA